MDRYQAGFGLIEILLIIIVAGVLGATGWYALHTKHQTDQILDQADKISQSIPAMSNKSDGGNYSSCVKSGGKVYGISSVQGGKVSGLICTVNGKSYSYAQ